MTTHTLLAYVLTVLVMAATPGPAVFAVVSTSVGRGLPAALALGAGVVCGDMVFLLLALAGLGVLAEVMGDLFLVIRLAGAAYLVWMGIGLWRSACGDAAASAAGPVAGNTRDKAPPRLFRTACGGLALTMGNPKAIVFYASFLPTFMDLKTLGPADAAVVALATACVVGCVLCGYAVMAARTRRVLSEPRAGRMMRRGAAVVMVGTGAAIITR